MFISISIVFFKHIILTTMKQTSLVTVFPSATALLSEQGLNKFDFFLRLPLNGSSCQRFSEPVPALIVLCK